MKGLQLQSFIFQCLATVINGYFLRSDEGICGKEVTPFILQRVNEITRGESLKASILLNGPIGQPVRIKRHRLTNEITVCTRPGRLHDNIVTIQYLINYRLIRLRFWRYRRTDDIHKILTIFQKYRDIKDISLFSSAKEMSWHVMPAS